MNIIKETAEAVNDALDGITEALGLIHNHQVKVAARKSIANIKAGVEQLAELADDTNLTDQMYDHPDFVSRTKLERECTYSAVEMYDEVYVKVQDLYDLFPRPDQESLI